MAQQFKPKITMKELLEAGVHFGHQTKRWNPKMKPYIFTARNGIYIIDLQQTVRMFNNVYEYVRELVAQGKQVLFVGTKKQAQESLKEQAERCGMPYVNQRWLGGMMTNFQTVKRSIDMIERLKEMENDGSFDQLTKKEVLKLRKKKQKLLKVLGGLKDMKKLPDAIFVVDPSREEIAVMEARKLEIPVIAIVDTNCDPDLIDVIIPGNDDAIRAIKLFLTRVANAVIEGKDEYEAHRASVEAEEVVEEPTISLVNTEDESDSVADVETSEEKEAGGPADEQKVTEEPAAEPEGGA